MSEKCIWIVDAAYLFKAAPGKFDYLKLKSSLETENGGPFAESYLNSTPNPPTDRQDAFHTLAEDRSTERTADAGQAI